MPSLIKHIIQKQVFQIEAQGTQTAGLNLQQQMHEVYYEQLLPKMEWLFDNIANENYLVRLDQLQINIEVTDAAHWQEELVAKTLKEIGLALRQENKIPLEKNRNDLPDFTSPFEDVSTTFFYFLNRGSLPWHSSFKNNKEVETALFNQMEWWNKKAAKNKENFLYALFNLLKNEMAIERLTAQFSERLLNTLFKSEGIESALKKWMPLVENVSSEIKKNIYWQTLIQTACWKKNNAASQKEAEDFMLCTLFQQVEPFIKQLPLSHKRILSLLVEDPDYLKMKQRKEAENAAEKNTRDKNEEIKTIYVDNAGLVIVQPFLLPFFEITGLWKKNEFRDQAAHERAVLLSQYLITGENEFPESDLLLNKIICGYPLAATLPAQLHITEREKNESEELLQVITGNWQVNGKAVVTTIDNLRASFLQRPGKLSRQNSGWLLQVEQRSYDLLLNSLPWTIGIIKQKWMPELLKVEWC